MKIITAEIEDQSKRKIQIQKELESIPYEVVKNTLGNSHKLLEITAPEDKKTLLQLIINKIAIKKQERYRKHRASL